MSHAVARPAHLKAIYATYLGQVGIMSTYLAWYFAAVGLDARWIGGIFAMRTAVAVVLQPLIMRESDRTAGTVRLLRLAILGCFVAAVVLRLAVGPAAVIAAMALQATMASGVVPLLDTASVSAVGARQYASIRVWGSVGYGVMVGAFGVLVAGLSYDTAGGFAVDGMVLTIGAAALLGLTLPRGARPPRDKHVELSRVVWTPALVAFLAGNALHWAGVTVFNVFLSLVVSDLVMPTWTPGAAIAVAIVFEIIAFRMAPRMLVRYPARMWIGISFAVTALRWVGTAMATTPAMLVAWQVLHFFSFGLWFAASMEMLGRFGGADRRGTLQGIFSAAVLAGGGVLGSVLGGALTEQFGGAQAFYGAAALDVAALLLVGVAVVVRRRGVAPS